MGIILSIIVVAILLYWIFPFESLFFYLLHLYCKFKLKILKNYIARCDFWSCRHLSTGSKKYLCTMQRYFLLCFNNHIFTVNFASVQQFIGTFKKNIIDFTAITFDNSERHRNVNIVIFINKIFIFDSFS